MEVNYKGASCKGTVAQIDQEDCYVNLSFIGYQSYAPVRYRRDEVRKVEPKRDEVKKAIQPEINF